jgi:hypothetical protein
VRGEAAHSWSRGDFIARYDSPTLPVYLLCDGCPAHTCKARPLDPEIVELVQVGDKTICGDASLRFFRLTMCHEPGLVFSIEAIYLVPKIIPMLLNLNINLWQLRLIIVEAILATVRRQTLVQ